MSKRLQVLIPDQEYQDILKFCRKQGKTLAEWVRKCLREGRKRQETTTPEQKIAKILKFAKYKGPTGDIDQILSEIEKGQKVKP